MDYQKHYNLLIERARNRILEGYSEKHHIIPRCMGGSDDENNLVALTPEEHYFAHLLLVKIHPGNNKLIYAVHRMTSGREYQNRKNNKLYGWVRKKISLIMQQSDIEKYGPQKAEEISQKKRAGNLGKKRTQEQKIKYRDINLGKKLNNNIKKKISKTLKDYRKNNPVKLESKCNLQGFILRYGYEIGNKLYAEYCHNKSGHIRTEEQKRKQSLKMKGKSAYNKGKTNVEIFGKEKADIMKINKSRKMKGRPTKKKGQTKMSNEQIQQIYNKWKLGATKKYLAEQYMLSVNSITKYLNLVK